MRGFAIPAEPLFFPEDTVQGRVSNMNAAMGHVVIVGGPEAVDELLALALDEGEAIPLFDSVEEADEFLASLGDFADDWRAKEVPAPELLALLEYQDDEVEYIALSPPPERMTGGMQLNVIPRESLMMLLERQATPEPEEPKGFLRRFLRR